MWYALFSLIIVMMILAACASPKVQPYHESDRKTSITQAGTQQMRFIMGDGAILPATRWQGEGKPEAVIVGVHGFNDYRNSFRFLGEAAARQRITVIAYDQRGFGETPERGIWGGEKNFVRDAKEVVELLRETYPDIPLYLMGESMGGAISMLTSAQYPELPVDGIILSAPAVWGKNSMTWLYRLPLWLAVHSFPSMRVTGNNLDIYPTDNMEVLQQMGNDPLMVRRTRMDAIYGIVGLMDAAYAAAGDIHHPTLFLYGANDEVIPRPPSYEVMVTLQQHRHAYYPRGFHLLTRDLQRDIVINDILAWVKDRNAQLPSGMDREVASRMVEDMSKGRLFKVKRGQPYFE